MPSATGRGLTILTDAATAAAVDGGDHYGPDQMGGMRGNPTRCRVAPAALDPKQRQRLWTLSEELLYAGHGLG
mgnify:CR=1 FL=1